MTRELKVGLVATILSGLLLTIAKASPPTGPYEEAISTCTVRSEFVKTGQLSGHGAAALVMCNGGSGAGSSVRLFVNFGPQMGGTMYLGEISGGNLMNVFFAGGYAYVTSALHGAMFAADGTPTNDRSACNQCYTRMLVERLSTREHAESPGSLLLDNGIAIIDLSGTADYRRVAQTAYYKATAIFGGKLLRSKAFIMGAVGQP